MVHLACLESLKQAADRIHPFPLLTVVALKNIGQEEGHGNIHQGQHSQTGVQPCDTHPAGTLHHLDFSIHSLYMCTGSFPQVKHSLKIATA